MQCENVLSQTQRGAYNVKMELKTRLRQLLDEKGISPYTLSQISGVPQPTIHRILAGISTSPRDSNIKKLAIGLNISEAELRGMSDSITQQERELLDKIHNLPAEQQHLITSLVHNLSKKER
ncbi:MAG TPA: XRE family transcriptional regulator [Alphaproteobacteria bacterium]|nr:XRE family transcriptional regulator [Alphaproteobacteria bacterium]